MGRERDVRYCWNCQVLTLLILAYLSGISKPSWRRYALRNTAPCLPAVPTPNPRTLNPKPSCTYLVQKASM